MPTPRKSPDVIVFDIRMRGAAGEMLALRTLAAPGRVQRLAMRDQGRPDHRMHLHWAGLLDAHPARPVAVDERPAELHLA